MDVIRNSTVASAGLPTKLNSQGDMDMPMEASDTAHTGVPHSVANGSSLLDTFGI